MAVSILFSSGIHSRRHFLRGAAAGGSLAIWLNSTGVASAEGMVRAVNEGFDFLALGRALLNDPHLPQRLQHEGATWRSGCTHCNQCVASMGLPGGIRCVLNQPTVFA